MNKIPVFGTVSRAFGFLIGDFATIMRLVWAPLLAAAALQYYYGGEVMDAMMRNMQSSDPSRMMEAMPASYLLSITEYLAGIIALVVLLRVVIYGDRKPGLFVYVWFGSAELRIIAVSILLVVALIAALIGMGIVFGVLAAIASQVPVVGVLLLVAACVLVVAGLWAVLRLSLITPVIVAEPGLGVERSWALMRGNALRMFLILLLTFIPLAVAAVFAATMVFGSDLPPLPDFAALFKQAGNDAAGSQDAFRQAVMHWQTGLFEAYRKHWLATNAVSFIYTLVSTALSAGVLGSAYVSATGKHG